jgi:hypothetical protein
MIIPLCVPFRSYSDVHEAMKKYVKSQWSRHCQRLNISPELVTEEKHDSYKKRGSDSSLFMLRSRS